MCEICHENPCDLRCPNSDEEPVYCCEECGKDIFAGEDYYNVYDTPFCEECIDEFKEIAE